LRYSLSKIIVGGSIESMLYAWRTQTKIIVKEKKYVFRFDEKFSSLTFADFDCDNPKHLSSNLSFALSLGGLMPYSGRIESVRVEGGALRVMTRGNKRIDIQAEEIVYFDKDLHDYNVYDFFDTRQMTTHDLEQISDDTDEFIKKINFYRSPRVLSGTTKDFIGRSTMDHQQLLSPDYGPGIAKIKVMRMLKAAGLKGRYSQTYNNKRYYRNPKIDFHKRIISQMYEPLHDFRSIYKMNQQEEKPWKTFETLRSKGETL